MPALVYSFFDHLKYHLTNRLQTRTKMNLILLLLINEVLFQKAKITNIVINNYLKYEN